MCEKSPKQKKALELGLLKAKLIFCYSYFTPKMTAKNLCKILFSVCVIGKLLAYTFKLVMPVPEIFSKSWMRH
jgi:hypothetical protein